MLAAVCWRRLRRNTIGLARFIVTAAVFYPVAAAWHGGGGSRSVLAAAGVIAATIAVSGVAGTARRFQRDPHLPAHLGLDPRASRRTVLTIPAIMAAIWAVLTAPAMAMGGSIAVSVVSAALGYAVVAYRLTRPEFVPSYAVGQQVSTDLARRFTRGPAQLIAACVLAITLAASL